jgi:CubicO group peptidase (beta-lactamase class C family)
MNVIRVCCALVWAGMCLGSATVLAQSPESIQEERALGFVRAVQMGDVEALLTFMHDNWGPPSPDYDREENWPNVARSIIERHSDLEIEGVEIIEPFRLTVVTRDPEAGELSFTFDYVEEPPYFIKGMGVEMGPGESSSNLPGLEFPDDADEQQIGSLLGAWFDRLAADDTFSGTALVSWRGDILFKGAWGLASKRWNVQNSMDTRFDLGSINKSFTQVAIGQLMSQGQLTLDDLISKHLPDYPNKEVADKVTIRHLLDHTSGLGDIFTETFFGASKSNFRSPRDFFVLFADQPLNFEPGEGNSYSNAGYMVLGAIIEAVSGQRYVDYVTQHIFHPAGMSGAGFFASDEPEPNVATGYTRMGLHPDYDTDWEGYRSNVFILPARGNSAGSAQASAEDLLHFDTALRHHKLLPPEYTAWHFGGPEPKPGSTGSTRNTPSEAAVGIAGGAHGVSAVLESDGELVMVVLANYDWPIAEDITRASFRPLKRALSKGK